LRLGEIRAAERAEALASIRAAIAAV
jgi:hypothetical protein